ncbi:MAG: hypothetical protein K9J06_14950, partial [Flavobacteriales bacterium]|nr:hypothetical protein [Flavobacteriales bacterium]
LCPTLSVPGATEQMLCPTLSVPGATEQMLCPTLSVPGATEQLLCLPMLGSTVVSSHHARESLFTI